MRAHIGFKMNAIARMENARDAAHATFVRTSDNTAWVSYLERCRDIAAYFGEDTSDVDAEIEDALLHGKFRA